MHDHHTEHAWLMDDSVKKRSKRGKGRKERMKHKLESLKDEREEFRQQTLKLTRKNNELKR